MIASAAAAALARDPRPAAPDPGTGGYAVYVRRLRARMAREVAVMLGVPAGHVVVADDPARRYGGHPGHVFTVHDPDDLATAYRFVPEPGLGGLYLLLDECPDCCAPEVPMATVAVLADLGRFLAVTRAVPPGAPDPEDEENGRPDLPAEFFGDPGHRPDCGIGRPPGGHGPRAGAPATADAVNRQFSAADFVTFYCPQCGETHSAAVHTHAEGDVLLTVAQHGPATEKDLHPEDLIDERPVRSLLAHGLLARRDDGLVELSPVGWRALGHRGSDRSCC